MTVKASLVSVHMNVICLRRKERVVQVVSVVFFTRMTVNGPAWTWLIF